MILQSILQVGVNSADSTEFTGPVEYLKEKENQKDIKNDND